MPTCTFEYAIIRVVPRVERQEFLNVGVALFCQSRRFLEACIELDRQRLKAFAPFLDLGEVEEYLRTIPQVCQGAAGAGPIGRLPQKERFHWLVAPRSTVIQLSPPHTGLCETPGQALEHLLDTMVRLPG